MAEISTQTIVDGITLTLRKAFPESQIFDDVIEQNLKPGAFNVIPVTFSQQQIVGERYRRTPLFDVLYYPIFGREDCIKIADRLSILLNVIRLPSGDLVRGFGMEAEIIDGVLHFSVRYPHNISRTPEVEEMDKLKLNQKG